jgi:uncharacterized membrane protein
VGSLKASIKTTFITGLVVIIPILVTIFVIWWAFEHIDGFLAPIYDRMLGYHIPGLGFLSTIVLIFLIGLFARNVVGQRLLSWGEAFLSKVPLIKIIYPPIKQLVDAFSPQSRPTFKRFVLVEYPRKGVFSFGFLTDHSQLESEEQKVEPLAAVYIPTNHLYLGEIVLFRREDVYYSDLGIEEGIKIILSGGIATPPRLTVRGLGPSLPS